MNMKIVFATNNRHKLEEIKEILGKDFEIVSLAEIGCHEDIPETGATLQENARQKSTYVVEHYRQNCFADDTGLEVDALGGEPGVHSARYAEGTDHDSEANMRKLLSKMAGVENRTARFRTVISEKHGSEGFGYDPIFIPEGYDKSFAELGEEVKNKISHRAKAVKKLAEYLRKVKG